MWVENEGDGRAERKRSVGKVLRWLEKCGCCRSMRGKRDFGYGKDMCESAQLPRKDDDPGEDHNVEHHVFYDGDDSRCAQTGGVGISRKDDEGCNERPLSFDAHSGNDDFHAYELQGDVRHKG